MSGITGRFITGKEAGRLIDGYVAKYLRISDDDVDVGKGREESGSISNQRNVLQYFISNHEDLSKYPVREFLDDGYSGVNFNRPGVRRLLKEVKENKVACIVVKDLSRFGRNYIEVGEYIEQIFPFFGVRFIAISDHYDSFKNPGGIEVGFKNLIHDMYSRDLSKKIKSVKHMHQEKGIYIGGDVPYGYVYSADREAEQGTGIYRLDPDAAEIVKTIFLLAVDGNTPVNIARRLNDEGILTPGAYKNRTRNYGYQMKNVKSNLWVGGKVRDILQNEVYIGTYICHKISTARPGEPGWNDEMEYLKFENAHEAIVSKDVFETAQKSIQIRGKRGTYKKAESSHALQGKVKCGCCGYSMNRSGKGSNASYLCRMGDSCGSHLRIRVQDLEETVLEILEKLVSVQREAGVKRVRKRCRAISEITKIKEEKRILEMKIEHCKTSRLNLYRQWKEQQITKNEYIRKRDEYAEQEEKYRERMRGLDEHLAQLMTEREEKAVCDLQVYGGIQALTKELADELIERIDVYGGDRVEMTWKFENPIKVLSEDNDLSQ